MTLQLTRPISLADVRAEYGAPLPTPLGAFVRGGAFVPDSPGNVGVPTAKPIALGDLLGSAAFNQTHTMVAGVTGPINGYDTITGPIGSMAPLQQQGEVIIRVSQNDVIDQLSVQLATPGLGQPFWTSMTFQSTDPVWDGEVLLSADANYSDNIFSQWQFFAEPRVFLNGVTYNLEWL